MASKHAIEPSEYAGLNRSINRVFSLFDRRRRSAPGSFSATSTTSRINAFPRLQFLDPAAQRLRVIIIGCGRPAAGVRGLIALRGGPVFGLQRGHAAPAVRPDPAMHRADAHAELFGGLLLLHAAQHQLDCPSPGLQWDDGFGHMASIPGIHRQPTLQTLPGRITQMLHHLGRRHRRGEIQLHRTLSFLKTEHTKIFPFGLQENVRSPSSVFFLRPRTASRINAFPNSSSRIRRRSTSGSSPNGSLSVPACGMASLRSGLRRRHSTGAVQSHPMMHRTSADAKLRRHLLLLHTRQAQFHRATPRLQRYGRLGDGIRIPGIVAQPPYPDTVWSDTPDAPPPASWTSTS